MAKLTKKQRKFLKTIENPKDRKYQKQQFKLQNKFDKSISVDLVFLQPLTKQEFDAFEKENGLEGKGKDWFTTTSKEVEEKFIKECERFFQKPDIENIENSLTKESLRDLTEPKTDSPFLGLEKPPLGLKPKYIHDEQRLSEIKNAIDRYFEENKEIPSEWIEEKYQLEKSIILRKSDNQKIPKEFCVEITEENKEVLSKVWNDFFNSTENCKIGSYLHSNSNVDYITQSNTMRPIRDYTFTKLVDLVSTEEFLRYIGKEDLIKYGSIPKSSKDIKFDEYKANYTEPRRNFSLGEIADKVVELALYKIAKTPDVKPLDFDLPKKENFNVKDYLYFDLEELFYRVNSGEITIMNLYNILREQKLN